MSCNTITFKYYKELDKVAIYKENGWNRIDIIELDKLNETLENWLNEQRSR